MTTLVRYSLLSLTVATAALVGSSTAQAQLLAYEGFDYADGTNLDGLDGGLGFAAAWDFRVGSQASAVSGSLADPSGILPASGNAMTWQGAGGSTRLFRTLDLDGALAPFSAGGQVGADGTTVYMSFLLQNPGDDIFGEISLNQSSIFEVGRGNLGSNGNVAFVAGIDTLTDPDQRAVSNKAASGTEFVNIGDTTTTPDLIVLKIDYAAGDDTLSVFLNPTSATTEPGAATGVLTGDFRFSQVGFGGFQGAEAAFFDELRIAGSYEGAFESVMVSDVVGDADGNGLVNLDDFEAIRSAFFSTVPLGGDGDTIGAVNGRVDLEDYVVWKREFELLGGSTAGLSPFGGSIPEPAALCFVLCGVVGVSAAGRRSRV